MFGAVPADPSCMYALQPRRGSHAFNLPVLLRCPVPITLSWSGAVPAVLFGSFFALYSRNAGSTTIALAAVVGAVGGAVSLIVHEVGHVRAALKTQGIRPVRVSLFSLGAATHLEGAYRCGRDQVRVALAGPAASFLFAVPILAIVALPIAVPLKFAVFLLALLNLAIAAFSLIPMHPFDGHKCLVGVILSAVDSEPKARRILRAVGRITVAADVVCTGVVAVHHPVLAALVVCAAAAFFLQGRILRFVDRRRADAARLRLPS
jgi:Zn-dependent protease